MPLFFINAALMAGAAAAVIPVIVHLLHRQKPRADLLPTLKFLKKGLRANRHRMRVRHLLVLFLRIAAVLVIVAALSRPAWRGALAFRAGSAPVSAVIVLDNSPGMAYRQYGLTRLEHARQAARTAVASLPPGSKAALVVSGLGPRGEPLDREFTFNTNALSEMISEVEISAYSSSAGDALARAWRMVEEAGGVAGDTFHGSEVYVFSDLAESSWSALSHMRSPEETVTFIVDVGDERNENFRIVEAQAAWRGAPQPHIQITATFEGSDLGATRLVEIHLDGAKRAERIIEVPAGAARNETFEISLLQTAGEPVQGWVALADADPLRLDNTFYLTVPPRRTTRCLVLSDSPRELQGGAFYVANALEPPALRGEATASVRLRAAGDFTPRDLQDTDCLILVGVESLSGAAWEGIEDFLERGGGLVMFLGAPSRPQSYNPFLRRHFGIEIGQMSTAGEGETSGFSVLSFDHPALAAFAGGRQGRITATRFHAWRSIRRVSEEGHAAELARLTGGEPVLLASPVGNGRAVVAAFAPRPSITDFPLRASFVPFVNEIASWASGISGALSLSRSDFFVGEAVPLSDERRAGPFQAEVSTPVDSRPVELSTASEYEPIIFHPYALGNYLARVEGAADRTVLGFSANLPPDETSLARISAERLESALENTIIVTDVTDRRVSEARSATRGAREIFDLFIIAAIVLLALEAWIANRFYRAGGGG